jgi:hypothetical protein
LPEQITVTERDDDLVTRLLQLWDHVPEGEAAVAAFGELYADPVRINGADLTVKELAQRAGSARSS